PAMTIATARVDTMLEATRAGPREATAGAGVTVVVVTRLPWLTSCAVDPQPPAAAHRGRPSRGVYPGSRGEPAPGLRLLAFLLVSPGQDPLPDDVPARPDGGDGTYAHAYFETRLPQDAN